MKIIIKFNFWSILIVGILLIISGAVLFIVRNPKNVSHFLMIAGMVQIIIAFIVFSIHKNTIIKK